MHVRNASINGDAQSVRTAHTANDALVPIHRMSLPKASTSRSIDALAKVSSVQLVGRLKRTTSVELACGDTSKGTCMGDTFLSWIDDLVTGVVVN
jgi:hypothetical protein